MFALFSIFFLLLLDFISRSKVYFVGPVWLSQYTDSLRDGRHGDGVPLEARFSAPVQTGPGAHPTTYTMGIGSHWG